MPALVAELKHSRQKGAPRRKRFSHVELASPISARNFVYRVIDFDISYQVRGRI